MTCIHSPSFTKKYIYTDMKKFIVAALLMCLYAGTVHAQLYTVSAEGNITLTRDGAAHFSALALKCIVQEFPNKTSHTQVDANDLMQPSEYHPAFYGCFDWHSSVHGHWMLVKLLKEFPDMPNAAEIRATITKNLTAQHILTEVAYFEQQYNLSFERTYGWAWLLKLSEELYTWNDEDARAWHANLEPLTKLIVRRYIEFLPKQTYPIRTGIHPNTAFGLSFALDYARTLKQAELEKIIMARSKDYYLNDTDCPASWEPSGADFFSPCLLEAELMRKVLPADEFEKWFVAFFPRLEKGQPANLLQPAVVSDRSDMQLVHLDGLNLSRAWCMLHLSESVKNSALKKILTTAAHRHLEAAIPHIANGDYAGEHWLASFAVYALYAGK